MEGAGLKHVSILASRQDKFTYKLLCFSITGRLANADVSSARASKALNRSMKNKTPPRGKTPAEVGGRL